MTRQGTQGTDAPTGGADEADGSVRERLERERGELPWSELVRHFARGVVVVAAPRTDFLDVAVCLVDNDTHRLQSWIDAGAVRRASDDDARDWTAREPAFLCVVVAPWVLVQERPPGATSGR